MQRWRTTGKQRLFAALSLLALAISAVQLASVTPAQAADARSFNAGNIISDGHFYNGTAMSAAEVQGFLDGQVPRCTIGDPGRTPGMPWGSTTIAPFCLKNASFTTSSRAANAYCSAYAGSSRESAASIIEKVGRACGISQKVLLVMLEKEQSLIGDTWPSNLQFERAMGYACPDSGPNGSAECDPSQQGFMQQVYRAAWQYKVYRAFPDSYRYRPFQNNTIQWHPNIGCGTSQVYIENWATAALYIYTPYRPNAAALNAQWGTGDACSTYGNRNFFMMYSNWFGAPTAPLVAGQPEIDAVYLQNGWLGASTSGYNRNAAWGAGTVRGYEHGVIVWNPPYGTFILRDPVRTAHRDKGGLVGPLGWPTNNEWQVTPDGKTVQGFQGGSIAKSGYGTYAITGDIRQTFVTQGGLLGTLGWPTNNEWQVTPDGKTVQGFQGGSIAKSGYGTYAITGDIRQTFVTQGGLLGTLGWPTNNEWQVTPDGKTVQGFQGGSIAKSGYGTYAITGDIRQTFVTQGGLLGTLGWPTNNEWKVTPDGKTVQGFQGGSIAKSGYGTYAITGDIRQTFVTQGGLLGTLGWPTNNEWKVTPDGKTVQGFQGGSIAKSGYGTYAITGDIRQTFVTQGGLLGTLGWPTAAMSCTAEKVCSQVFQGGTITVSPRAETKVELLNAPSSAPATPPAPQDAPESEAVLPRTESADD